MSIPIDAAREFAARILVAAGSHTEQAEITASALAWNDSVGRMTQGLWRLPTIADRLVAGGTNGSCKPSWTQTSPGSALLAGDGGDGYYLGHLAMTKAIDLAATSGIAAVGVNSSNHFGSGAYFVELACKANMLGFAFSNSIPKQAPHGGNQRVFGTNPVAFGAPRADGHSILVDFSTAASAGSTVRKHVELGESPPEDIFNKKGGDDDPLKDGVFNSFGGAKGYGLAVMVEILCGIVTGAASSHEINSFFDDPDKFGGLGHLFIAFDVSKWQPLEHYYTRIDTLTNMIHAAGDNVRLPGELRWQQAESSAANGIDYDDKTLAALALLGSKFDVQAAWK